MVDVTFPENKDTSKVDSKKCKLDISPTAEEANAKANYFYPPVSSFLLYLPVSTGTKIIAWLCTVTFTVRLAASLLLLYFSSNSQAIQGIKIEPGEIRNILNLTEAALLNLAYFLLLIGAYKRKATLFLVFLVAWCIALFIAIVSQLICLIHKDWDFYWLPIKLTTWNCEIKRLQVYFRFRSLLITQKAEEIMKKLNNSDRSAKDWLKIMANCLKMPSV